MGSDKGGEGQTRPEGAGTTDFHPPEGNFESGRSLMRALRNTDISILYQDLSLHVAWHQNVPSCWSGEDITGRTDADFLPAEAAERMTAAKEIVRASGEPHTMEISVPDGSDVFWYEISIDADKTPEGVVAGLITTAVDVSDRKRREQTLRALLREVSHRSKNLLAIIQSIANQTGRYSGSVEDFLIRFRGRLQSLASSQDLVTMSNWRGADLRELVVGQVGRYVADAGRHLQVDGENPYLNPNAALHVGLALHELAVNSVSFGALSKAKGIVTISAEKDGSGAFTLIWREAIPPRTSSLDEKRFGRVALERVVPAALNGTATLTIGEQHLEYRLTVPASSFEFEAG